MGAESARSHAVLHGGGTLDALGYIRVSTDRQADRGISLQAQTARIRAQAKALGLVLIDIVADRVSGKSLSRPGVQRIMSEVATHRIGAIVVWKLDRLTRSVRDLLDIIDLLAKHHVRLISITESLDTDSAMGRMVMTIVGAVAQMEREQTAERVRMAAKHMREIGRVWGTVPFGFRRRGARLIRNEKEIAVCRIAAGLRSQGKTYQEIADALNVQCRWRPRTGVRWSHQHAHRIVTRFAERFGIKVPSLRRAVPQVSPAGYRTDGAAHRDARLKVPAWRRAEIAKLGAMGRARRRRSMGNE